MARMLETTVKLPPEALERGKEKARKIGHDSLSRYIRDLVLVDLGLTLKSQSAGNGKGRKG